MRRSIRLKGAQLGIAGKIFDPVNQPKEIYALAVGKAALPMAVALEDALGEKLTAGFLSGSVEVLSSSRTHNLSTKNLSNNWRWCEGGHPLPNEASLFAAKEAFDLLRRADKQRALLIFLISGGGSAMIEWPSDERITLADLRAANNVLISCGASIYEVNAVRRAFSAVKGGQLSLRAPNADQVSLIISDTNRGEEGCVASGPTVQPAAGAPDPRAVVMRYRLETALPLSIMQAIKDYQVAQVRSSLAAREFFVLLSNESALEAAAEAAKSRGFIVEIAHDLVEQPVDEGCVTLIARLNDLKRRHEGKRVCLLSGGEFACPVKGYGLGGRNSETALRCAIEIERLKERGDAYGMVALSAGTDGIDGNSPAAGSLADSETISRARELNLNLEDFLAMSASFSFFQKLGDEIITGATGTNVRDLRVLLS